MPGGAIGVKEHGVESVVYNLNFDWDCIVRNQKIPFKNFSYVIFSQRTHFTLST